MLEVEDALDGVRIRMEGDEFMVCEVCGSSVLATESVVGHVMEQVRRAVGRFGGRVGRVRVRLEDVNGPRGGRDKRCTVDVAMAHGGGHVIVRELSEDLYVAISGAARRVKGAVSRKMGRGK
jgi:hypothetical protein